MSDIKRNKDAGIPGNGGKFAPDQRDEATVSLARHTNPIEVGLLRRGDIVNVHGQNRIVMSIDNDHKSTSIEFDDGDIESFDNGEELDMADLALAGKADTVANLLPRDEYDHDGFTIEDLESFPAYDDYDWNSSAEQVARKILDNHGGDVTFNLEHDGDGQIDGFSLGKHLDNGLYVSQYREFKYLTDDREAKGVASAVSVAEAVESEREGFLRKFDAGHEETSEPAPVWPQNDDEREAFEDYKYEVSNGDTAISFRDWYANRDN